MLRGAQRSTTVVYVDISALSYTGVLYEPFRTSDVRLCNAELLCWHRILPIELILIGNLRATRSLVVNADVQLSSLRGIRVVGEILR